MHNNTMRKKVGPTAPWDHRGNCPAREYRRACTRVEWLVQGIVDIAFVYHIHIYTSYDYLVKVIIFLCFDMTDIYNTERVRSRASSEINRKQIESN